MSARRAIRHGGGASGAAPDPPGPRPRPPASGGGGQDRRGAGTARPVTAPARLAATAATHPGAVRARNEDSLVARDEIGLWAVADGAGGHGAGDVASAAIAAALRGIPAGLAPRGAVLAQVRLRLAAVHDALRARAAAEGGPGRIIASTVVALVADAQGFACAWAGDSRAYVLRGGRLARLTRDHSLVQEMVDAGRLAEAEAERHPQANVILRAVGADQPLELDQVLGDVLPEDRFLLCSDGLFKALPEAEIRALLLGGAGGPALVEAAVARKARDNVSAVVVAASPS